MESTRKYKSRIFEAAHETAHDFYKLGVVSEPEMRKMDELCLAPALTFDGSRIRALRERLQLSRAQLASQLNISISTVRRWEQGEHVPNGSPLKLLEQLERVGIKVIS